MVRKAGKKQNISGKQSPYLKKYIKRLKVLARNKMIVYL